MAGVRAECMVYLDKNHARIKQEILESDRGMIGVAAVKNYDTQAVSYFEGGSAPESCAEDSLIQQISDKLDVCTGTLGAAKVVIAMNWSPCRRCTGRVSDWLNGLHNDLVTLRQGGLVLLRFCFRRYYSTADGLENAGKNSWNSINEAVGAYQQVAAKVGSSVKYWKGGEDTPCVKFLHWSEAENGGVVDVT